MLFGKQRRQLCTKFCGAIYQKLTHILMTRVIACGKLVSSATRLKCLRAWGVLGLGGCCLSFSIPTKACHPCKTAADEHPPNLKLAAKLEQTHPSLARISRKLFALKECVQKTGRQPSEHARPLDKYVKGCWTHPRCKWDELSPLHCTNQPCVPNSSRASWFIWEITQAWVPLCYSHS